MKRTRLQQHIIDAACEEAGGLRALGRKLGIPYQSIQGWTDIPAQHLIAIEAITGIPREKLRPELYAPRKVS